MSNVKLSDFTTATGADGADFVPLLQGGANKKVSVTNLTLAPQTTANTAVTNAATAQSAANAAQSDATTALANAATAQTTANTGVTNAATAQSTANTAVTNAATAQTTANTGVTNAATAQSAANAAQSDATTALANAATAQSTANAAIAKSLVDAKGDLLVGTANDTVARLAVGTNDYVLTADSAQTGGVKWAPVASGSAFSGVTAGTNAAALVMGSGGSLLYSGTGIIDANKVGGVVSATMLKAALGIVVDGGGSVISTGLKGMLYIPFDCTIIGWTVLAADGNSGAIQFDVWRDTYANFPPTVADTITASDKPTIVATNAKGQNTNASTWSVTCSAGDFMAFNVDSCTTLTRVTLAINVNRR